MEEKTLVQDLEKFDFSRCHQVRENLLNQLLTMHRRDNARKNRWQGRMSDEDLELAAAAGNPSLQEQENKEKDWK